MNLKTACVSSAVILALMSHTAWGERLSNSNTGNLSVEWKQERLNVVADDAPISQVMLAIADKTGLEIQGIELLKGNIQANFSKLPLALALRELLQKANYLLQEPSGSGSPRYVLSVLSYSPVETLQKTNKATPGELGAAAQVPATAGYVPEQYRKLYAYAKNGDMQALSQVVSTGDPTAQAIATKLLAQKNPGFASELAAETAKSSEPNRRLNAIQSLAELDNAKSTHALGAALHDPNIGIRTAAVLGLHNQTSTDAVSLLAQGLQDEEQSVRLLALDLLAEKGADGVAGINEALNSNDPQLKEHAQELLQQIIPDE